MSDKKWTLKSGESVFERDLPPETQKLTRRASRAAYIGTYGGLVLIAGVFLSLIAIPVLAIAAVVTLFTSGWATAVACLFFAAASFAVYRGLGSIIYSMKKWIDGISTEMSDAGFDVSNKYGRKDKARP